jgi:hypothetical protein
VSLNGGTGTVAWTIAATTRTRAMAPSSSHDRLRMSRA